MPKTSDSKQRRAITSANCMGDEVRGDPTGKQRSGVTVLLRQASTRLQIWYEPAVVGAAVALFGLAYLLPVATVQPGHAGPPGQSPVEPTAFAQGLYNVPTDPQFYREKWIAEAAAFYAAHPPQDDIASMAAPRVIQASARTSVEPRDADLAITDPPIADSPIADSPEPGLASTAVLPLDARARQWRVITCLASGLLASLLFVSIWPLHRRDATVDSSASLPAPAGAGEAIPVSLPSAWIGLRPTWNQTAKRGVMGASYLIAAISVWGIMTLGRSI